MTAFSGAQAAPPSPRPPVAGVLRHVAVLGLLADVVFFVVAMALGGVDGNLGRAARSLVALVILGNRLDGFLQRLCHHLSPLLMMINAARAAFVATTWERSILIPPAWLYALP